MAKVTIKSGGLVFSTANTAERLVSASSPATKFSHVVFHVPAGDAFMMGGADVDITAASLNGVPIGDGTNAGSLTLDVGADDAGLHMKGGEPYIDLYDIWVDSTKSASDEISWFGW